MVTFSPELTTGSLVSNSTSSLVLITEPPSFIVTENVYGIFSKIILMLQSLTAVKEMFNSSELKLPQSPDHCFNL